MTQEELDALMAGDLDEQDILVVEEKNDHEEYHNLENLTDEDYVIDNTKQWPPPPPTDDHKVVNQLDDVTRESEVKATEIFDKLEAVSDYILNTENSAVEALETIQGNIDIFQKLSKHFPNIQSFQESLEATQKAKEELENTISNAQMGSDEIMMIMDIMQYQDIHRQKIERVINVMRALARYMNGLFEGKVEDSKRVGSAVHIEGDGSTVDVVSNADIEALINSLGA